MPGHCEDPWAQHLGLLNAIGEGAVCIGSAHAQPAGKAIGMTRRRRSDRFDFDAIEHPSAFNDEIDLSAAARLPVSTRLKVI